MLNFHCSLNVHRLT